MSRPKYTLTVKDGDIAYRWIDHKLNNNDLTISRDIKRVITARKALETTTFGRRYKILNEWSETYLTKEEWKKLKDTLRAYRKRRKDKTDSTREAPISTNLTPKASKMLGEIAKHYRVTQSDVIERFLKPELDRVIKRDLDKKFPILGKSKRKA
jgi:macrodomain Ter protein organizer (MatP/YcbG family)